MKCGVLSSALTDKLGTSSNPRFVEHGLSNGEKPQVELILLRYTHLAPDSDPEGWPRRILDRTPSTRITTTTGFSTLIGLVQAQESYLQSQQAQADMPDIQFLQAEIDGAREKQSETSKGTLRQIFSGVDEVFGWVFEGDGGQLEMSIETLLEITSGE